MRDVTLWIPEDTPGGWRWRSRARRAVTTSGTAGALPARHRRSELPPERGPAPRLHEVDTHVTLLSATHSSFCAKLGTRSRKYFSYYIINTCPSRPVFTNMAGARLKSTNQVGPLTFFQFGRCVLGSHCHIWNLVKNDTVRRERQRSAVQRHRDLCQPSRVQRDTSSCQCVREEWKVMSPDGGGGKLSFEMICCLQLLLWAAAACRWQEE